MEAMLIFDKSTNKHKGEIIFVVVVVVVVFGCDKHTLC